jgi:hypothetical protein
MMKTSGIPLLLLDVTVLIRTRLGIGRAMNGSFCRQAKKESFGRNKGKSRPAPSLLRPRAPPPDATLAAQPTMLAAGRIKTRALAAGLRRARPRRRPSTRGPSSPASPLDARPRRPSSRRLAPSAMPPPSCLGRRPQGLRTTQPTGRSTPPERAQIPAPISSCRAALSTPSRRSPTPSPTSYRPPRRPALSAPPPLLLLAAASIILARAALPCSSRVVERCLAGEELEEGWSAGQRE